MKTKHPMPHLHTITASFIAMLLWTTSPALLWAQTTSQNTAATTAQKKPDTAAAAAEPSPHKDELSVPPRPKNLDQTATEPVITIRKEGSNTFEEYRIAGKLYMIKVTPTQGAPYFLIDREGRGSFSRSEGPVAPLSVPQWVIFEF